MAKKNISLLLASCLLFVLLATSHTAECSGQTYTITEEQLTILETNLTQLKENNQMLLSLLNESNRELATADSSSMILEQELNQALAQIEILQSRLTELKSESEQAKSSLVTANEELASASESLKRSEEAHMKTESALRTQKILWQAIAIILGGVAIAK